jgi:hypothetical protein
MDRNSMKIPHQLRVLKTRHTDLETRIRDELARPMPDLLRTQTLKRLRLRTKDQIALISRQMTSGAGARRPEAA